jgi:hypothetical protein
MRRSDQLLRVGSGAVLEAGAERVLARDAVAGGERTCAGLEIALPFGAAFAGIASP